MINFSPTPKFVGKKRSEAQIIARAKGLRLNFIPADVGSDSVIISQFPSEGTIQLTNIVTVNFSQNYSSPNNYAPIINFLTPIIEIIPSIQTSSTRPAGELVQGVGSATADSNEQIIQQSLDSADDVMSEIQNKRPEIILMSEFSPLVDSRGNDTDAGKYFNLILSSRKLKLQKTFEDLQEISIQNPEVSQYFKDLYNQNIKVLSTLEDSFKRVLEIFRIQESFVEFFDPRSTIHEIDYDTSFSKIFGDDLVEDNVDEPNSIKINDIIETETVGSFETSLTGLTNSECISKTIKILKDIIRSKFLDSRDFNYVLNQAIFSKNIISNNLNYSSNSNVKIIDNVLNNLLFGTDIQLSSVKSEIWENSGSGLINFVRNNRVFTFESQKILSNSSSGFNFILRGTKPLSENSFNVSALNGFLTNSKFALQKMDLIKSYGLIPFNQKNDGKNINLSSSKDLVDYLYNVFYTPEGVFKFDETETSARLISYFYKKEPHTSEANTNWVMGPLRLKLRIFELIIADLEEDNIIPKVSEGSFDELKNQIVSKIYKYVNEQGFFTKIEGLNTDDDYEQIKITEQNIRDSLLKTNVVYNSFDISSSENLNLYGTIAYLVKSFAYFLITKCSLNGENIVSEIPDERSNRIETIRENILSFYMYIIEKILEGSFQKILAETGYVLGEDNTGKNNFYIKVNPNFKNNQKILEGFSNLKSSDLKKDSNTRRLYCFLYEFFEKNHNQALNLESQLKDPANLNFLKNIWSFLEKKSEKLFTKHQVTISLNQIDDYKRLFERTGVYSQEKIPNLKFDDSTIPSERTEELFKKFVNNLLLREGVGGAKKIISIGIPNGLVNQLIPKSSIENDIFKIKIYKIDLTRPNIVFQPQEFKFELSRFILRDSSLILQNNDSDIKKLFPTKDLSSLLTDNIIQYFRPGERYDLVPAFSGEKYSFLSGREKEEIYSNHITSYMLEIYLRIMNGISLDEPSIKERLSENEILNLSLGIRNILGDQNILVGNFNPNLQGGNLSSSEQIAQSILSLKKFDRVFNIVLDDLNFLIDIEKSTGLDTIESSVKALEGAINAQYFNFESYYVTFEPVGWE